MRILQVITSLRTGGAERLVVDLSKQLKLAGDEVEILLFDGTETPLKSEAQAVGIPVHALSKGWRAMRNPLLVFKLVRFFRRNRCDIIHTHNTACQLLAAVSSCFVPIKLVTTEHNTDNRRRGWRWCRAVDRWMYGRYRRIVCVGAETKSALVDYLDCDRLAEKMVVINNGIDVQKYAVAIPAPDLAAVEGHRILMVSAFRPQKDQLTLIRALAVLPIDYSLFLAGGSETAEDQKCLEACRRFVKDFGLAQRVCFLGVRSDVPQLLAAADTVVLSTAYEGGTSLAALEAMSMGKPLLASDVPGVHDLVADAGLLFPFGDTEKLAELIVCVCGDKAFAAEVGAKCRARAAAYDMAETARNYRKEYEK